MGHEGFCYRHSPLMCAEGDCDRTPCQGSECCWIHDKRHLEEIQRCKAKSVPFETACDGIVNATQRALDAGRACYIYLAGESVSSLEIETTNNIRKMWDWYNIRATRIAHFTMETADGVTGHRLARLAEQHGIGSFPRSALLNQRPGGDGCTPIDETIGHVCLMAGPPRATDTAPGTPQGGKRSAPTEAAGPSRKKHQSAIGDFFLRV